MFKDFDGLGVWLTSSRCVGILAMVVIGLISACGDAPPTSSGPTTLAFNNIEPTPTLRPDITVHLDADRLVTPRAEGVPLPTANVLPTETPRPTQSPIPTPTPSPGERLLLGRQFMVHENYAAAAEQFRSLRSILDPDDSKRTEVLEGLGLAYYRLGELALAADQFNELLSRIATEKSNVEATTETAPAPVNAYFFLGQVYLDQGNCPAAIGALRSFLSSAPSMSSYIWPMIAECYLQSGDQQSATDAFQRAVTADSPKEIEIANREKLAVLYLGEGDYSTAAEQYLAISGLATTDRVKGRAVYLAGTSELLQGDFDQGYGYFRQAIEMYPVAYESYLALQTLLDEGIEVDDFQRGVVDFYARAYDPAILYLQAYISDNPTHDEEAHIYLGWTYEALGDIDLALAQLDAYIDAVKPGDLALGSETFDLHGRGLIERAKLLARNGRIEGAITSYQMYVELYPDGEFGAFAAWWQAALSEQMGDWSNALTGYLFLADTFPGHEDAPEALYRAGLMSVQVGEAEQGSEYWIRAAEDYPNAYFGAAGLVMLLADYDPLDPSSEEKWQPIRRLAERTSGDHYYAVRVRDIINDIPPFARPLDIDLIGSENLLSEAGDWMRDQLNLDSLENINALPIEIELDGRLVRGEILMQLGMLEEAKLELESLRFNYRNDALASFQLSIRFRDIGLYRSSILAASSVLEQLETDSLNAPAYIARLAYPVYYADLVLSESEKYGFDPLLQFALIRQESLFESFATSTAVAQGLSQVIPDTGAYIAERLNWPDYENEDLYLPYVGIAFGAYYLDQQLDAFGNNAAIALSAYNGGPGNASRWSEQATGDLDQYIEIVDFAETRLYIERIYAGQAIYRHLYGLGDIEVE